MNIVFDLGGVVFDWNPEKILDLVFADADTKRRAQTGIFEHADWVALDRGTLEFDSAVARGAERTGLPPDDIEKLLNAVPTSLTPFQETIDLIRSVRSLGHPLYVLSNMQFASISYLEEHHDIWHLFDGTVISCRIHRVKPEPAIFEYLLAEHRLIAAETVFIDDVRANLEAASEFGIRTIQFADAAQCQRDLAALGCL